MKTILIEEINRISNLMSVISEGIAQGINVLLKRLLRNTPIDDLIRRDITTAERQTLDNLLDRTRRAADGSFDSIGTHIDNLTTQEISKVFSLLDTGAVAKIMMDNGMGFTTSVINTTIDDIISNTARDVDYYSNVLKSFENQKSTFFGLIPNEITDENILKIIDEYYLLFKNKLDNTLKNQNPDVWNSIITKTSSWQNFAKRIPSWIGKNNQTILRSWTTAFRGFDSIAADINAITKQIEDGIRKNPQGVQIESLTKQLTDLIIGAKGKVDTTIDELYTRFINETIPYDIRNKIDRSKAVKEFRKKLLDDEKLSNIYLNALRKLIPFGQGGSSIFSKDWWRRLSNLIVRVTPFTADEKASVLASKGFGKTLINRIIAQGILVYGAFPILYAIFSAIKEIGIRAFSEDDSKSKDETLGQLFKSAWLEKMTELELTDIPGFDTLIDDIIDLVIKVSNLKGSDVESVYDKLKKDTEDATKKIEEQIGDIKNINLGETNKLQEYIMSIKPGLSINDISHFVVIGQENDAKPKYVKDGKLYNLYIDENNVIIYEKTKGEYVPVFDDENTQTTTNESPEQRWLSEHSNGSFKKLNPNKPTTWLYYTEPNNQGDRYIYKDNQFIQK